MSNEMKPWKSIENIECLLIGREKTFMVFKIFCLNNNISCVQLLCSMRVKLNVRNHMFWLHFWGSWLTKLWKVIFYIHWGKVYKEIWGTVTAAPLSQMQGRKLLGDCPFNINWYGSLRLTYKTASQKERASISYRGLLFLDLCPATQQSRKKVLNNF